MSRANSAVYGALAANVAELVDTLNSKIRVRNAAKRAMRNPLPRVNNNFGETTLGWIFSGAAPRGRHLHFIRGVYSSDDSKSSDE